MLVTDPAFAGSDTLATARALAAAMRARGPVRPRARRAATRSTPTPARSAPSSPSCSTSRSPPASATSRSTDRTLDLRCEHDDGWVQARVDLPAVLSTAERLIDPCKVDPEGRAAVAGRRGSASAPRPTSAPGRGARPRARRASVACGSSSPSGSATSCPTRRSTSRCAARSRSSTERGALDPALDHAADLGVGPRARSRRRRARSACSSSPTGPRSPASCSARPRRSAAGSSRSSVDEPPDPDQLGGWGADEVVRLTRRRHAARCRGGRRRRRASSWVRERRAVGGARAEHRVGARGREPRRRRGRAPGSPATRSGSSSTATGWSRGSPRSAASSSPRSTPTRRRRWPPCAPGCSPSSSPRVHRATVTRARRDRPRGRVHVLARTRDDDLDVLAEATVVVGVGQGVAPEEYPLLEPLRDALGAELAATRKVTDRGWLPRARQVGITGRSIAPRLYVVLGASGKFNHMVGVRAARTVLAVNTDPDALVFDAADVGIVGDWREVAPAARRARSQPRRPADVTSRTRRRRARGRCRARRPRRCVAQLDRRDRSRSSRAAGAVPRSCQAACAGTLVASTAGHARRARRWTRRSGLVVEREEPGDALGQQRLRRHRPRVRGRARPARCAGSTRSPARPRSTGRTSRSGPGPTPDTPYLYVGDIGDNARAPRRTSSCTASPSRRSSATAARTRSTGVDALHLHVPRRPHDAEALMVDPRSGELYIIIKHLAGGPAGGLPRAGGPRRPAARPSLDQGRRRSTLPLGLLERGHRAPTSHATAAPSRVRTYGGVRLWNRGATRR